MNGMDRRVRRGSAARAGGCLDSANHAQAAPQESALARCALPISSRRHWLSAASTLALAAALQGAPLSPAAAQTAQWVGGVNGNWFNGANWNTGTPPTHNAIISGPPGTGAVIDNSSASITGHLALGSVAETGELSLRNGGVFGPVVQIFVGSPVVLGSTSTLFLNEGSKIESTSLGFIRVGEVGTAPGFAQGTAGTGQLQMENGASISGVQIYIADAVGSIGSASVRGAGTSIFVPATGGNTGWVSVGFAGTGSLNISEGATVTSQVGALATQATGNATVSLSGGGSLWTIYGGTEFHVGGRGIGKLDIFDGAQVNAMASPITIGGTAAGANAGQGEINVNAGSLTNTSSITVGLNGGTGTLRVSHGGNVTTDTIVIAGGAGSIGTLDIGAKAANAPTAPGTIDASSIQFGGGTGTINFNHTSNSYFFGVPISGFGSVHQIAGTTIFTADNTYTGGTTITGGTLVLGDGGTRGSIVGNVQNDATLIFDRSNRYDFHGVISGSGQVIQDGTGTTNLTATNTYTGPTFVNDGTLLVNGSIVSQVTVNAGATLGGDGIIFNGVNNAGNVAPGNSIGDLTITGAYVGLGGTLTIESILAGNSSPTDHLILAGPLASASGTTGIVVVNLGGPGGLTTGNGIPVVIATGGATTTTSAFQLAGPVAAGPFQYFLFRGPQGAGSADDQNTWYLRSHTTAGAGLGGGGGGGGGPEVPIYRPETAIYGILPTMARSLAASTLGTFHERNGDQALVGGSKRERMWGRVFGQHTEQTVAGTVDPSFDGHAAGFQAGADAYEAIWQNGMRSRAGFFVGWAEARGDIRGNVLGQTNILAGDMQLEATSMGTYGTLVGYGGWYVDSIMMASFYSGDAKSTNGISLQTDGWSLLSSLEAGVPFRLGGGFTLEPQAQLIYQHLDFDNVADPFSTVHFDTPNALSGRIGVRLAGTFADGRFRPYLKANVWHDWLDKDGVIYAGVHRLDTSQEGTALEVGGGLVVEMAPGVGLWGVADYTTDIAGDTERETWRGNAGVRITW